MLKSDLIRNYKRDFKAGLNILDIINLCDFIGLSQVSVYGTILVEEIESKYQVFKNDISMGALTNLNSYSVQDLISYLNHIAGEIHKVDPSFFTELDKNLFTKIVCGYFKEKENGFFEDKVLNVMFKSLPNHQRDRKAIISVLLDNQIKETSETGVLLQKKETI